MITLETERLILRPWSMHDLDDFYEYAKNPNIGPNAGWKPHESREESARILQVFIKGESGWAIEYRENRKVIGSIDLHIDRKREGVNAKAIGYVLAEPYWGKGLMGEAVKGVMEYAFSVLGLDLLSVYHYPTNHRSQRVIEKCGFKYEGLQRMASRIYDGTILDEMCYSITRDEYFAE